ncbi:MAG TPA: hypothetical protein VHX12_08195 [Acidisoma sp.]|jgi:hypothetical protein|nr:hypothetical protein [Acidisoma sp.]
MSNRAHIDVSPGEKPVPGEKFIIALQENSEMLGLLDDGRTFRFKKLSTTERDYQQENRSLNVVSLDLAEADGREERLVGVLTYQEA